MGDGADMAREREMLYEAPNGLTERMTMRRPSSDPSLTRFFDVRSVLAMKTHFDRTDAEHWAPAVGSRIPVSGMAYRHALFSLALMMRWGAAAKACGAIVGEDPANTKTEDWLRERYPVFGSLECLVAAHVVRRHDNPAWRKLCRRWGLLR